MTDDHSRQVVTALPKPLYSTDQLIARVATLGREISDSLPPGPIHVVGILRGAFIFMADLVRAIPREVRCDFLAVRSYGSATQSSGVVEITHDLQMPIAGQHVLIVEDIVDTGLTMRHLLDLLKTRRPASLQVCALLNKPSRRKTSVPIDFAGFEIPDVFVVGYGLDHDQRYRNLPYLGVIEE